MQTNREQSYENVFRLLQAQVGHVSETLQINLPLSLSLEILDYPISQIVERIRTNSLSLGPLLDLAGLDSRQALSVFLIFRGIAGDLLSGVHLLSLADSDLDGSEERVMLELKGLERELIGSIYKIAELEERGEVSKDDVRRIFPELFQGDTWNEIQDANDLDSKRRLFRSEESKLKRIEKYREVESVRSELFIYFSRVFLGFKKLSFAQHFNPMARVDFDVGMNITIRSCTEVAHGVNYFIALLESFGGQIDSRAKTSMRKSASAHMDLLEILR